MPLVLTASDVLDQQLADLPGCSFELRCGCGQRETRSTCSLPCMTVADVAAELACSGCRAAPEVTLCRPTQATGYFQPGWRVVVLLGEG